MIQAIAGYIVGQLVTAAFFVWWMYRPVEAEALRYEQLLRLCPRRCQASPQGCGEADCQGGRASGPDATV